MKSIKIGTWIEKESRKLVGGTSYAADWIVHQTHAGEYDLFLLVDMAGFLIPMPQYITAELKTDIIGGKTYSGFGGLNFASNNVQKGPSKWVANTYSYHIPAMVEKGLIVLDPEFTWLDQDSVDVQQHIRDTKAACLHLERENE